MRYEDGVRICYTQAQLNDVLSHRADPRHGAWTLTVSQQQQQQRYTAATTLCISAHTRRHGTQSQQLPEFKKFEP